MKVYTFSTGIYQQQLWPGVACGQRARQRKMAWHELANASDAVMRVAVELLGFPPPRVPGDSWRTLPREFSDRIVTAYLANDDVRGTVKEHLDKIGVSIRVYKTEVSQSDLRDALIEGDNSEALLEVVAQLASRRQP